MAEKEETALVTTKSQAMAIFDPTQLQAMVEVAKYFHRSAAIPAVYKNEAQVLMAIQAGIELGLPPVEALNSLYIVNGAIRLWGAAVPARLRRFGYSIEWIERSLNAATVKLTDESGKSHTESFTMADAQRAGLANKDIWVKYPKDMLAGKAMGRAVRAFAPHVLSGYYTVEEDDNYAGVEIIPDGEPGTRSGNTRLSDAVKGRKEQIKTAKGKDPDDGIQDAVVIEPAPTGPAAPEAAHPADDKGSSGRREVPTDTRPVVTPEAAKPVEATPPAAPAKEPPTAKEKPKAAPTAKNPDNAVVDPLIPRIKAAADALAIPTPTLGKWIEKFTENCKKGNDLYQHPAEAVKFTQAIEAIVEIQARVDSLIKEENGTAISIWNGISNGNMDGYEGFLKHPELLQTTLEAVREHCQQAGVSYQQAMPF